jgi:hypothetical protein
MLRETKNKESSNYKGGIGRKKNLAQMLRETKNKESSNYKGGIGRKKNLAQMVWGKSTINPIYIF